MYSGNNLQPQAQPQNALGPVGSSRSANVSVDCNSARAQKSANICRTQRSSHQVLDPSEQLAIRRKQTEPTASLQVRSADLMLE